MKKSFSKIKHLQHANIILENRYLSEKKSFIFESPRNQNLEIINEDGIWDTVTSYGDAAVNWADENLAMDNDLWYLVPGAQGVKATRDQYKLIRFAETATFDDFSKMDLRVGTIIEAEKMPKADKLLVLKVDTGLDVRTIVSGIAEHFTPEEVIGKRVTVLVNLAPRALRGVESQGMLLLTQNTEGQLVFVNPDAEGVANGATIS